MPGKHGYNIPVQSTSTHVTLERPYDLLPNIVPMSDDMSIFSQARDLVF